MKKRVSQASHRISNEKKQLNSLLKVLRPKVYITDTSRFKSLVQELTGNGNGSTVASSPTSNHEVVEQVPVFEVVDHGDPESSLELSVDSTDLENQMLSPLATFTALQTSWINQQTDTLQYDIDSCLSGVDPFSFYDGSFSFQDEQDLSISDYNLSDAFYFSDPFSYPGLET